MFYIFFIRHTLKKQNKKLNGFFFERIKNWMVDGSCYTHMKKKGEKNPNCDMFCENVFKVDTYTIGRKIYQQLSTGLVEKLSAVYLYARGSTTAGGRI